MASKRVAKNQRDHGRKKARARAGLEETYEVARPDGSRVEVLREEIPLTSLPTSKHANQLLRIQAQIARAEHVLRREGPWAALRVLGITTDRRGPRCRTDHELQDLAVMYLLMVVGYGEAPSPVPCILYWEHEHLWLEHFAQCREATLEAAKAAKAEGRPLTNLDLLERFPATPAEGVFYPDRDAPMSKEDALRNLGKCLRVRDRQAFELVRKGLDLCEKHGWPDGVYLDLSRARPVLERIDTPLRRYLPRRPT